MKTYTAEDAWRALRDANEKRRLKQIETLRLMKLATWQDERDDFEIRRRRALRETGSRALGKGE